MLGALVYAFNSVGSPFHTRALKLDQTRIRNFQTIRASVENYFALNHHLPTELSNLPKDYYDASLVDPETNQLYEYVIISDTTYKLCTSFSTDSSEESKNKVTPAYGIVYNISSGEISHKKGHDCVDNGIASVNLHYLQRQPNFATSSPATQ
jgi:hypothetical protein